MTESVAVCDDGVIVATILIEVGISPSLQGFNYLKDAILLYKKYNGVMKDVIKEVAKKNDASHFKIEKAMRFALNDARDRSDFNRLNATLQIEYIKPNTTISAKEFIVLISEYINNDYFRNEILKKTLKNL